jgi:hypothetical protein
VNQPVLALSQEDKNSLTEDAFTLKAAEKMVQLLGLTRRSAV